MQQNISGNYKWTPMSLLTASTEAELIDVLRKVRSEKRSLRVIASAWSSNQFLNPNTNLGESESGYNLALKGDLGAVPYPAQWRPTAEYAAAKGLDLNEMVTVGAACQRQGIYTYLDTMGNGEGRDIYGSGECFTSAESQQLGGLIANAVHDTMECAFTPETVVHVRAAIFKDGEPIIRDFSEEDGDAFYALFGGFGAAGVIVAATLITKPRSFYHKLAYSPGPDVYNQYAPNTPPPHLEDEYPINSLEEALLDLAEKAGDTCDGDLAAIFVIFSNDGKEDKLVLSRALSRYFKKAKALPPLDKPGLVFAPVKRDAYNDPPAFLAREYCTTPQTIEALVPLVMQTENAIIELKYKASNMKTLGRAGYSHEAFYEGNAARITGPHYVYLWEKGLEFYVPLPRKTKEPKPIGPYRSQYFARTEEDYDYSYIKAFSAIVSKWVRKLLINRDVKTLTEGAQHEGAAAADHNAPVSDAFLSDCRFVCASEKGFMTGFYGEDVFAVDVGCQKFHFTNEEFTAFAVAVLDDCIEQKIPVRLHTGKFFIYERKYIQYMYGNATKREDAPASSLARLDKVRREHDPENVFAPAWMRDLFAPDEV